MQTIRFVCAKNDNFIQFSLFVGTGNGTSFLVVRIELIGVIISACLIVGLLLGVFLVCMIFFIYNENRWNVMCFLAFGTGLGVTVVHDGVVFLYRKSETRMNDGLFVIEL